MIQFREVLHGVGTDVTTQPVWVNPHGVNTVRTASGGRTVITMDNGDSFTVDGRAPDTAKVIGDALYGR